MRVCNVEGCNVKHHSRGFCLKHYNRDYNERRKIREPLARKSEHYLNTYGLSLTKLEQLHKTQNYRCALCEKELPILAGNKGLFVDHCHETGKIRGLLCINCNRALGVLGDDIKGLTKALNYMKGGNYDNDVDSSK